MEKKEIKGISVDDKIVKIEINNIKNYKKITKHLFSFIKNSNIRFNMLKFDNINNISFVVNIDDRNALKNHIDELKDIYELNYYLIDNYSCLTIVGLGFSSTPQLSLDILELLNDYNIDVNQVIVNNFAMSLLLDKKDVNKAIRILMKGYKIGE